MQPPLYVYRSDDVRAMDRVAIETHRLRGYLLMTRAASDALALLRERWPAARRMMVVCGAGNNAGDGYVLARLALDAGMRASVWAVADPDSLTGDARQAHVDYLERGGRVSAVPADAEDLDIVVDALLGTGLRREVSGRFLEALRWMNKPRLPVVSLDVPSGLDADSGRARPEAVQAELTVTFIASKTGLYTGLGPAHCGEVVLRDLEVPNEVSDGFSPVARLLDDRDIQRCLPRRRRDAHKGDHGRVLVVGGDRSMGGAAALTAAAALRSGAGSVTVACHPDSRVAVSSFMPEVMCVGVREDHEPSVLEELAAQCDVVALGPGLGQREWGRRMFTTVNRLPCRQVVDADALRWLARAVPKSSARVEGAPVMPAGPRLMTPHPGEAAALLGSSVSEVQQDRLGAAVTMASRYGGAVVLKGAGSVVAAPDGDIHLCAAGNPGMATAGSGDVLTGIAAGLWAQQNSADLTDQDILGAAVYVHAKAGDHAAKDGQRGLVASDLLAGVRLCVNQML